MENGVLVVYASKYGATAEIAEKIAKAGFKDQYDELIRKFYEPVLDWWRQLPPKEA